MYSLMMFFRHLSEADPGGEGHEQALNAEVCCMLCAHSYSDTVDKVHIMAYGSTPYVGMTPKKKCRPH